MRLFILLTCCLILCLTPHTHAEPLGNAEANTLYKEAQKLYTEKNYLKAANLYLKCANNAALRIPSLYNAACCCALSGDKVMTLSVLRQAIEAGYGDLKHIKEDEDFASVRGTPEFGALLDKLRSLPLRLDGPTPDDATVRKAIRGAVDFVLTRQSADGSWDVVLTSNLVSETADKAVDAVAMTSLCGLALRQHQHLDPRIHEACQKAAKFVMSRILRGRLSTRVDYAVWRYTFGLMFLTAEFEAIKDHPSSYEDADDYRDQLILVSQRMVNSLAKMQLMGDSNTYVGVRRRPLIKGDKDLAMPGNLGLVVAPPSDDDFMGGALVTEVLEDKAADRAGVKVGDRILRLDSNRIENGYDYYEMESNFVGGQTVTVKILREGEKDYCKAFIEPDWPGTLGTIVTDTQKGVRLEGHLQFSPAKSAGLKTGDRIFSLNDIPVTGLKDFRRQMAQLKLGDEVRVGFHHAGNDIKEDVRVMPVAPGRLHFKAMLEDRTGKNGIVVESLPDNSPLKRTGIQEGDRITHLGHIPIMGIDHYIQVINTMPSEHPLNIRYTSRDTGQSHEATVIPLPMVYSSSLDVTFSNSSNACLIEKVTRRGVADKAGFEKKDIITAVEAFGKRVDVPNKDALVSIFNQFPAGNPLTFVVKREGRSENILIDQMPKNEDGGHVAEEGGWNYYNQGVAATFVTASVLIAIKEADKVMGSKLKAPRSMIKAALNLLDQMRVVDKKNGNVEGYLYRTGADKDIRGHMGRLCVCELALAKYGKRSRREVGNSLALWLRHRHELDRVRKFIYTHDQRKYQNAAYYWMFGHHNAMRAANLVKGRLRKEVNAVILNALMETRQSNNTWLGHVAFGDLCGTAQALMIFGELQGDFRDPEK